MLYIKNLNISGYTRTHSAVDSGCELMFLLPPTSRIWFYRTTLLIQKSLNVLRTIAFVSEKTQGSAFITFMNSVSSSSYFSPSLYPQKY